MAIKRNPRIIKADEIGYVPREAIKETLRVSDDTLEEWRRLGLARRVIGKKVFYSLKELQQFMEAFREGQEEYKHVGL